MNGELNQSRLRLLLAQREALEVEAEAIAFELNSPSPAGAPPAGVKAGLTDSEGFPRGDIDIVSVLQKRHRLAVINTDHKLLMKDIEHTLRFVHEAANDVFGPVAMSEGGPLENSMNPSIQLKNDAFHSLLSGIAVVDEVSDGGPAMNADIRCGDIVISFGDVSINEQKALSLIPKIVQDNLNKKIPVTIARNSVVLEVEVVPSVWGGRGLLGCHLSPL